MANFLGDARFPENPTSAESRALEIAYFQNLYRLHPHLEFKQYEERPLANAELGERLLSAFEIKCEMRNFDDGYRSEGGLFHRSLLWRRGEDEAKLSTIDFPIERGVQVPSWSWMAYKGGIDYTDPSYRSAVWEMEKFSHRGLVAPPACQTPVMKRW
jgi:hypothetical protein